MIHTRIQSLQVIQFLDDKNMTSYSHVNNTTEQQVIAGDGNRSRIITTRLNFSQLSNATSEVKEICGKLFGLNGSFNSLKKKQSISSKVR
jgi:hypothetical protein